MYLSFCLFIENFLILCLCNSVTTHSTVFPCIQDKNDIIKLKGAATYGWVSKPVCSDILQHPSFSNLLLILVSIINFGGRIPILKY